MLSASEILLSFMQARPRNPRRTQGWNGPCWEASQSILHGDADRLLELPGGLLCSVVGLRTSSIHPHEAAWGKRASWLPAQDGFLSSSQTWERRWPQLLSSFEFLQSSFQKSKLMRRLKAASVTTLGRVCSSRKLGRTVLLKQEPRMKAI